MASNSPSRNKTVAVFSASVVAAATVSGLVAYFNGDTYQAGTHEATTLSGSTVTAGGGSVTISDGSSTLPGGLYRETLLSASGTYALAARIQNPAASGSLIQRLNVECNSLSTARNMDIVVQASPLSNSGAATRSIKQDHSLAVGTPYIMSGSFVLTYSNIKLFDDQYIVAVSATGATQANNCKMKLIASPLY